MKNNIAILLFISTSSLFAHYIWIETAPLGMLNQEHQIKVRFGEYAYGVVEKVSSDSFKTVSDFTLWLVTSNGKKTPLQLSPKEDYYSGSFIPTENGTYTLVLDNKNIKVLDYTKHNYGIFKPQYNAKAEIVVGEKVFEIKETNPQSIEIVDISNNVFSKNTKVNLQVLYKGKPLIDNELFVFVSDLWTKKLTTDKEGKVSFKLPWATQYVVKTTYNEKVPGKFKGLDYEFIWHCATYCIMLD